MQEVKKLPTRAIQVRRISTPKIYHLGMKMNIMTIETGNVFQENKHSDKIRDFHRCSARSLIGNL